VPKSHTMKIAVLSDLHVLSPQESERSRRIAQDLGVDRSLAHRTWERGAHRVRRRLWNQRDEDREIRFLRALDDMAPFHPDWIVANGDYSGDTNGVGLSDAHTFESVSRVIDLLRRSFPDRCLFVMGDHELGKYSTVLKRGGIRLASLLRGENPLGLQSFWHLAEDPIHLIGVNSTLLTLPLFLPEALEAEIPLWQERRDQHLEDIRRTFSEIPPDGRILLFCHDPSALGVLAEVQEVRGRLGQIERTLLGHLHFPFLLHFARGLGRLPNWTPRYPIARIITHGAKNSKTWDLFHPVVCPSTFGLGRLVSGGWLLLDVSPDRLTIHRHSIV